MKKNIIIAIMLSLMLFLIGCSNSGNKKVFGEYIPKEILYVSASSSVSRITLEKNLTNAKYIIEKDKFEVNSPGTEYKISNPIYEIKEMNDELIDAFNDAVLNTISIAKYKNRNQYIIMKEDNMATPYYLYSLDKELWIASYGIIKDKYYIKYLYKLK